MANNIIQTTELVNKLNSVLTKHSENLNLAANNAQKLNEAYKGLPSNFVTSIKNIDDAEKKLTNTTKQLEQTEKQLQQQRLSELKLQQKREQAFDRYEKQIQKIANVEKRAQAQRELQVKKESDLRERLARQKAKELADSQKYQKQLEKNSGFYNQTQRLINKVTKSYQDLALKKQLGIPLSNKEEKQLISLQAKLLKYNNALKQVDAQIGRNQRNVGNYKSALVGLGGTLRTLAGAFGLTSGVFLFAQGIKDAFNRIRQFDKAMQNIAGIMRTTRSEIKDLESEIVRVAGSSVKTSREVAELAENLVTLGKTKSEIKQLLEPVNNLAIGLETTSGEAAEFLVQTLNAFGAGSDEAAQYADTIATIRTSTSLDFQKMRDSFQYLAPISKILNKDLAYTGALIGVVADRGIKAEQAGRLLGTAQMRLASQGKTLIQGLEELNELSKDAANETESLALATKMFGVNAAKVGVTLAGAIEKVGEYEDRINSSKGALDDLVNEQLKSLDATLEILNSTWEKLLFSIESGDNILSKLAKGSLKLVTLGLENVSDAIDVIDGNLRSKVFGAKLAKQLSYIVPNIWGMRDALIASADATINIDELTKKYIQSIDDQTQAFIEQYGSLAPLTDEQIRMNGAIEDYLDLLRVDGGNKDESQKVNDLRKQIAQLNKEIGESKTKDIEGIRIKQDKIKQLQAELNAILGIKDATKKFTREKVKSIAAEAKGVESLKKQLEGQIEYFEKIGALYVKGSEFSNYYAERVKLLKIALGELNGTSLIDVSEAIKEIGVHFKNNPILTPPTTIEDDWRDTFTSIANTAQQAFSLISEASNSSFDRQYANLEKQKEAALLFAGDSAAGREEIERQYEKKRKKIQEEQAKAEKKQAIFSIAINTAQAVATTIGQTGFFGIPLAAIVGALGAAQLAIVASTPIPQFWQGGEVGSNQQIMVNDDPFGRKGANYKEVIEKPNGQILTPQGKNVKMTVPKGSYVHPTYDAFINSLDTELINNNIMPVGAESIIPMIVNNGLSKSDVLDVMNNHANRLVSTIERQHGIKINIDENGISKYVTKKGHTSKVMNARYSGKGISV